MAEIDISKILTEFQYVFKLLNDINDYFTEDQLHYSFKKGKIILLLDGFDEVDQINREQFEKEMLELSLPRY